MKIRTTAVWVVGTEAICKHFQTSSCHQCWTENHFLLLSILSLTFIEDGAAAKGVKAYVSGLFLSTVEPHLSGP